MKRMCGYDGLSRVLTRKPEGEHASPDYTVNGPPIAEFNRRMEHDPLLEKLREIGAPMYEDVRLKR